MNHLCYFVVIYFIFIVNSHAQNSITGYVNVTDPEQWEPEVHLRKINLEKHSDIQNSTLIASAPIDKNGYFSFDVSHIDKQPQLYKIYLTPISETKQKGLSQTIDTYKHFILSKKDTIHFEKGEKIWGTFTTNSKANKEWKQFQQYQSRFDTLSSIEDTEEYLIQTRGYVKDSLHILLVKLIGIKTLDDKNLLEKDIQKNTAYYAALLAELKTSDLDPELFLFLENRLLTIQGKQIEQKYYTSYALNITALFAMLILSFFLYRLLRNRKKQISIPLSKQEKIIKELIISGKTNKEIADTLFISISTVKTHISNIYSKLNISNRKELIP